MAEAKKENIWEELRKPFPKEAVGKIPKGGIQLDYVGHAAVTDRLLSFDPLWTWEPLATDEHGLPIYDERGGLWIKLTVKDVTRLGYGDGPDPKQRIGDAIRNAAMRFGVALELWTKDELESNVDHKEPPKAPKPTPPKLDEPFGDGPLPTKGSLIVELYTEVKKKGITEKPKATAFLDGLLGKSVAAASIQELEALIPKVKEADKEFIDVFFGEEE